MEANNFVAKLKADSPEKYNCDLRNVIEEYKSILTNIPRKDRGLFGLNILRTLCWNLEKAPIWRDQLDNTSFLYLAIDCVRECRILDKEDRVKTLACIYHIHRHAVRLVKLVPPELVLKISFMPFELDANHLIKEYHKTYWNILADRLTYIEKLKTKANILKVLPKLTEDIAKVIKIYDTIQFCSTILTFLVKKLHIIYADAKELSKTYKVIFAALAGKSDIHLFQKLSEKEMLDVYMKLNDCIYIIADNSYKMQFTDDILDGIVYICISLVGHRSDLLYCLQTCYKNFCSIISEKTNMSYVETIFNSLQNSMESAEELGYKKAMQITYPYINQLLRLFIEWQVINVKTEKFTLRIQESCLKLILFFMKKLRDCTQILKCENCSAKSGLHDALRLSFLIKHFITICLSQKLVITNLFHTLNLIIEEQYNILQELKRLRCANYEKYYRKLQTDIHNAAISLNKAQYFEFSINLFEIYLKNELQHPDGDYKNITRALFNKSICELDAKLFESAVVDAFLSLIFSGEDSLKTDKYMSLVMDVKAKELKSHADDDDDELDVLQLVSVLDAARMAVEKKLYGDLTGFISKVKFSSLLQHEFKQYAKLWPSIAPVGGVWRALTYLAQEKEKHWITAENKSTIQEALYSIVLETPSVVRTMHSTHFTTIVQEMLDQLQRKPSLNVDEKLVLSALLCLQCEYDLTDASHKYGWKQEPVTNPDNFVCNRTLAQEHTASGKAVQALQILLELMPHINKVSRPYLSCALQIFQIFVPLLLQLSRDAPALQYAYICMHIADVVHDVDAYLRNAGFLLTSQVASDVGSDVITRASHKMAADDKMAAGTECRLVFLCDVALYYISQGCTGAAARLVRAVQAEICDAMDNKPQLNLDLPVGRLLEAQNALCPHNMSAVNSAQRHYLAICTTGTKWSFRRLLQLTLRTHTHRSTLAAVHLPAALGLASRARAGGTPALHTAPAGARGELCAATLPVGNFDEAQVKIDTHLKQILGLEPNCEAPDLAPAPKHPQFTPKQEVETMRDVRMYRQNQTSPSLPWISVPPVNIPDFFKHDSKCVCYGCQLPIVSILTCKTVSLEAQTYAYANENEIARNYFQAFLDLVKLTERKLKQIEGSYKIYEDFVVEAVMKKCKSDFKSMYIGSLVALAFFELKMNNLSAADGYIVEIHEIVQEIGKVDPYLSNEVLNLMTASAKMKETTKNVDADRNDFDNLSLTPIKVEQTPEKRPSRPPKQTNTNIKVKDEEVPKKRTLPKFIKIEDNDDENDFEKPVTKTKPKKHDFKIPNPIIPTSVYEEATRIVPKLLLTQPSDEVHTPTKETPDIDYSTPASDSSEEFFTPMTSIKTYAKKSLRHDIVKNLQQEFSTPGSVRKENKKMKEVMNLQQEFFTPGSVSKENKKKEVIVKEDENIKEDRSSKRGVNNFVIKEDDVNQLSSALKVKMSLKDSVTKVKPRKEVTSAVKEDRSVIRELNSAKSLFERKHSKKQNANDSPSSKENKATKLSRSVKQEIPHTKEVPKERPKRSTKQDSSKDNVPSSSRNKKENLVRAVSPGKLLEKSDRESNSRPKRGRQLNLE